MLKILSKITNEKLYGGKITATLYDKKENILYIDVEESNKQGSPMEIMGDESFAIAIWYV